MPDIKNNKVSIIDIDGLVESLKHIQLMCNKGCRNGAFEIDEVYVLRVALTNIQKGIETLDFYKQMYKIKNTESDKPLQQQS